MSLDPSIPVVQGFELLPDFNGTIKNNGQSGDGEVYGAVVFRWDETDPNAVYEVEIQNYSGDAAGDRWLQMHSTAWPTLSVYLPAGNFEARVREVRGVQPSVLEGPWTEPIAFCISTSKQGKGGTATFC